MKSIVESARDVVKGREGDFLTMLVGNGALYVIPNSAMACALVDSFAAHEPQSFVESVGLYLSEQEVA